MDERTARNHSAPDWIVKRRLSANALVEYVKRLGIERQQVVAITEPEDGVFSLIYEPTDEQRGYLEAEEGQVAETLDTLFGPAVTPVHAEEAVEAAPAIVAVPTAPEPDPAPSPS